MEDFFRDVFFERFLARFIGRNVRKFFQRVFGGKKLNKNIDLSDAEYVANDFYDAIIGLGVVVLFILLIVKLFP